MPRYIDPEKIDFRLPCGIDESGEVLLPLSAVRSAIAQTPGEDVVEVVRCRDCVWWEARTHGGMIGRCENPLNGLCSEYSDDEDFCSYGKRKEQA